MDIDLLLERLKMEESIDKKVRILQKARMDYGLSRFLDKKFLERLEKLEENLQEAWDKQEEFKTLLEEFSSLRKFNCSLIKKPCGFPQGFFCLVVL